MTTLRARLRKGELYTPVADSKEGLGKLERDALLRFASAKAPDNEFAQKIFPLQVENPKVFFRELKQAHEIAAEALESLCTRGIVRRKTETKVNSFLEGVRMDVIYTLEGGEGFSWGRLRPSGIAAYVAYLLTQMVQSDTAECVEQCKLTECRRFFWAPIARGRRPKYCSERHRIRGSKREQRGQNP